MKVYRFEKNCSKRLKTILDGSIYLSRPKNFNDLEDCKIKGIYPLHVEEHTFFQLKSCIEILYPESGNTHALLSNSILKSLKSYFLHCTPNQTSIDTQFSDMTRASIVNKIRDHLRTTTGICCFFKGPAMHPLMWAHYANNHTGFCVEYNIHDTDHPLVDVNYSTKAIIPSINELLFCPQETLENILTTKSIEWNYEKETRLVYLNEFKNEESGRNIELPDTMTAVRLIKGENFDRSLNTELIRALNITVISYKDFVKEQESQA